MMQLNLGSYLHFLLARKLVGWALVGLVAVSCHPVQAPPQGSAQGVVDLSGVDFGQGTSVLLNGQWEFYWQQFLTDTSLAKAPPPTLVPVPASWDSYDLGQGQRPSLAGYATYRLRVVLPPAGAKREMMAIKTQFIATNYALYVQGQALYAPGRLGTSARTDQPHYNPEVFYFTPQSDTVSVVVQAANFSDRLAGITQSISLGQAHAVRQHYETSLMVNFFLFGVLVVMGSYHLSLFFFRRKSTAAFWFALYCLVVAIRILVTDDYYLYDFLPQAPFELGNKLAYLTFYLAVPILATFARDLYPADFARGMVRAYWWLGGGLSGLVLASPGMVYSHTLVFYQVATLVMLVYALYFTGRILWKRRDGSMLFATGLVTTFVTGVNDVLFSNLIIQTANLLPLGLFVFIFSQTLILSRQFSRAFLQVEALSAQLQASNQQLEQTVTERTMQLREANEALSQNLEELSSNIELINEQNREIRAQHQSITASIRYAQIIQTNILPGWGLVQRQFPESFLLFRPKAMVSGDFYYFNQKEHLVFLAAVDCTGHGVPGAFMSLIGVELLNELIDVHHQTQPAAILQGLHRGIRRILKTATSHARDGMDLALVVLDTAARTLTYAGARSPLVYVRGGELGVVPGDRLHLGGSALTDELEFAQTTLPLPAEPGQFAFYLFSDGYQDQFGGGEVKKFMKKHFRELLFQVRDLPMAEQGRLLTEWHEDWKGTTPQTDDILVMGFRV
jgi:serine phosphatase RsbU (regulator of sigma subunit)